MRTLAISALFVVALAGCSSSSSGGDDSKTESADSTPCEETLCEANVKEALELCSSCRSSCRAGGSYCNVSVSCPDCSETPTCSDYERSTCLKK